MATMGLCGLMKKPLFFRRKSFASEAMKGINLPKNKALRVQKKGRGETRKCSFVGADQLILMMEIQRKILAFRDIMDLPPCNSSASLHEIVIKTLENLQRLYPEIIPSNEVSEIKNKIIEEGLAYFCKALKSLGESWNMNNDSMVKSNFEFPSCKDNTNLRHLGETLLATLDFLIKMGSEKLDVMEEEEGKRELRSSFSESNFSCSSPPLTPTSVLPEGINYSACKDGSNGDTPPSSSCTSPLLWSLRLQAVGKLNPIDVKRLSFHVPQHVEFHGAKVEQKSTNHSDDKMEVDQKFSNPEKDNSQDLVSDLDTTEQVAEMVPRPPLLHQSSTPPPPPPPPSALRLEQNATAVVGVPPPPLSSMPRGSGLVAAAPPPPPPIPSKGGSVPAAPPVMARGNGGGPPPPPPGGAGRCLRPKATTKLKRSTHLGNLYRTLKGKVEGSSLNGKSSGRRSGIGQSSGGKQGMADALAEMTKRSSYFQQIEEDVQKYTKQITELRSCISNFKTNEMMELVKFHKAVESVLENLTDESQVLSRFEGFPTKKLEAIRMAAALYNKLNSIVTELQNWNIVVPLSQFLDKVERYFNKIKTEVDALERTKDEESKKFKSHNIEFDFHILIKIKEAMVDVSSNCMELALKESREGSDNGKGKMLWRAFQFAFRVYTFAGGHDDRADTLTRELAREIESKPIHT